MTDTAPTTYRYTLRRSITDNPTRPLGVCMVNPSMALEEFGDDKTSNDNTIRSLCRIAAFNGFDGLVVVNVSPFRATDPDRLVDAIRAGFDVFRPEENDEAIARMCAMCETVVVAWGALPLKHRALEKRTSEVRAFLLERRPVLHCLGKTKGGFPRHPLYLPATTKLTVFATRDT